MAEDRGTKPLVLKGARQVGKPWLMKQFGKTCYEDYFYIKIDFMLQNGMEIIPVEVKAGDSIRANSFKKYIADRKPRQAIRFSELPHKEQEIIVNIPFYLVGKTKELLK